MEGRNAMDEIMATWVPGECPHVYLQASRGATRGNSLGSKGLARSLGDDGFLSSAVNQQIYTQQTTTTLLASYFLNSYREL